MNKSRSSSFLTFEMCVVRDPRLSMNGLSRMSHPSLQTLKHLRVGIFFNEWDSTDPLSGLTSELEEIRTIQSIETISINIAIYINSNCPRRDEWGMLDKTLARPGWSKPLQVSLGILIYS